MLLRRHVAALLVLVVGHISQGLLQTPSNSNLFTCPVGWELRGLHCYKFFSIRHSWENAAQLCSRYGSELVPIESYAENNYTANFVTRNLGPAEKRSQHYWLGLASVDDLRTNALETARGIPVSQYSGFWSLAQPNSLTGECVDVNLHDEVQSWQLQTCETLLPFLCRTSACPIGSYHCSNGKCVNSEFRCDRQNDCGDWSDELDCPSLCHYYMASSGDVVESPNFPHKYESLSNCKWTLEGPQGHNIFLQFQEFETEKSFDTVQILVGGRTEDKAVNLATLSGKLDLSSTRYVSASNFMIVKFSSDASVDKKGFRALWKTEPQICGGNLFATTQPQTLTSPGYPQNYPGGLECLYTITAQAGRIITLEIDDIHLVHERDYIVIRDGDHPNSPLLASLTGDKKKNPRLLMSTGNNLYMYFKTSLGETKKGFKIRYSQGCRATITDTNGTISSPAFGLAHYSSNLDCLIRIKNPSSGPLSLKFNSMAIHSSDVVQIYDGGSTSGLRLHPNEGFTGNVLPKITVTASSGEMLVRFITDALHNSRGWHAVFSSDCPVLRPGEGALASNRDTAFGTIVTFTCAVGQEFATGKTKIVTECLMGGNWSVTYIPKCQEVYCGPVPQIDNGFSTGASNVTYRGIARYQCYAGFGFPSGQKTERISCLADGRWEKLPSCQASQCPPLAETPHANVTILNGGGRSYGTIIRFECEPGYVRNGYPVVLCMSNGTWSSALPTCTRAECPTLPEIANGIIVDPTKQYLYGDEARIQCHRGFKLTGGSSVIKCGPGQKFMNVPKCDDVNECSASQCDGASTDCMNTAGSFHCKCRGGFSPNLDCRPIGDLGLISGNIPDDAITVSGSEPGFSKENVRLSSTRGWCGSSVEPGSNWVMLDLKAPTVIRGFKTQGVLRETQTSSRGPQGGPRDPMKYGFTTAIRIQYANNLTDVFKDYNNLDGETPVEFRIPEPTLSLLNLPTPFEAQYVKFKILGYHGAPCLRLEIMGCTKLECMDINECAVKNGGCDQKCINTPGNHTCACNVGYELYSKNGTAGFFVDESESGERDGDIYQRNKTCVPVMCPKLDAPENGKILARKNLYHFGDHVYFHCNFGYIMIGSSSLLCTSTGAWNGTIPQCQYAKCVSLPDDKAEGLSVLRANLDNVLVPFKENVTLKCNSIGRKLRGTASSGFRQCVYDPKPGLPDYWLSGMPPSCPRVDCGPPMPTPGAEYGNVRDTKFHSSFFFGCQDTFRLAGQTERNDNVVRCEASGIWDFGDLRCEGPVCEDPGRPVDGFQITDSYEQGSEVNFGCSKPGYILINPKPIKCIPKPECKVIKPLGITSGRIPDAAINATSERPNYEARNIRLNSVTGWCGKQEAFTYVSVDLGYVYRIKAILVKGVVTNDIIGRPTEIRFFYKQAESENFVVYFPNFNLTMRDPGNYGELSMIMLPKYVSARFVILGIVSYMDSACLKFELMGCEEPKYEPLLGYDYGYSPCVDNETPVFQDCPQEPIVVRRGEPVNMTEPSAVDNSGSIARWDVKPQSFKIPHITFHDMVVKYTAFDYDGNVAMCEFNITVADETPPQLSCPQSYVIELVDKQDSYEVNFNETRRRINVSDASGEVFINYNPEKAVINIGDFENVTVTATDKFGNRATCYFQVSVQATSCVDWELTPPANGALNCLPDDKDLQCIATCSKGFRFTDGEAVKTFICEEKNLWSPSSVVPDCVSEDTQQADYNFVPSITYRSNGAVAKSCLEQYADLVSQYYHQLNTVLTQRCSAVNVNMNVSFLEAKPSLLDDNYVQIDYILGVLPAIRQPQLYDLCGSTLNLIFDLSVPYASAAIEPLLNVSAVGNQCPPLKALKSTTARGFSCNIGEVLNMDMNQVPRCLHCPAGTSAGFNQKSCTLCPRGFYQDRDRQGSCARCPAGTYTREEGSKSLGQCIPVCGYGTYSPTGLVPCLECPRNSYTMEPPLGGFKECHSCPSNTFTYQPAAPSKDFCRAKCSPGHYSETGLAPCTPCPANFYQSLSGQSMCQECPSSTRTKGSGSAGREECQNVVCTENSCLHGGLCVPMGHTPQCFCPAGFSGRRCEIDINECASQPCYNGAVCIDLPQGYKCQCKSGYSGINCQEEKSDCRNDTCPQRAMCKDEPGVGNYTCLCRSGYTGENCDMTVNPCTTNGNPCKNEAKCIALKQGRYKCDCPAGWEGQHCDENIDDCAERPCLLGASCTDLVNDFKCTCPPGFTGKRCETKIDLCADHPCENGICVDKLFNRQCICHPGWSGSNCEINIDECEDSPCMNGGECTDLVNDFKCSCNTYYTGKRCQHLIDDCSAHPCRNGGSCIDMLDGFQCLCRPGFVGLQCEAEIDECLSDPCHPEGTDKCLDLDNKFKCVCHPGFSGDLCDVNIDDCASRPCLNNGKCLDGINKYSCKCPAGWTGTRCEIDISSCQSTPCLNDAKCINLFQDYFCVCPSGTDGKQCETAPERCIGNPCMHSGKCQDFGSGLNCSCSADFTGIGCQYEFDACQAHACKNGGTCIDNGIGYLCVCPAGFTGKNCEEDIVDCKENSCPPTATCIDLTDKFYCQCPFNLTGDDCRKTIQVDYDLSFPEAGYSSAALQVPFRFEGSRQSLTIAMWVQFSRHEGPGVFFTLYSVTSGHLVNNRRALVQAQAGGVQVSIFSEIPDVFLSFQEYATINDGQWHHIAIVWHQGTLTLITEGLIASKAEGYGTGKKLPEFGWVVLGQPHSDNTKSYTEQGFEGHLSRVQIWGRTLDFTNEIQKQVRDCRTEPVLYQGLILTWAGYDDIQGGVERIVPSHCSHHVCPVGYSGPQCDQMMQDKTPPKIDYCPGDLWVITKNGSAVVFWDEPKFSDNVGVVRVEEKSGHHSGQNLMWGNYQVVYVAFDGVGNAATCSFKVYVLAEFCPPLADPIGGSQVCKDWGHGGQFKVCEISCNAGLRFSEPVPKFYTCGAEGFWRPTSNPNLPVVYPACSQSKPAQRVFKIGMKFPTSVLCNEAGQGVLRQKVRTSINALNREWNFCSSTVKAGTRECKDLNIEVKCEHRATRSALDSGASYQIDTSLPVRREKRETGDTYAITISFPAINDPVSNLNFNQRANVQNLLERLILEENQFDVHDILPNTVPDPASLILESDYACPLGEVVVAPDCVPCAVGTYFNKEKQTCIPCPLGTYQSETGQMQCTSCPNIAGRPGVTIDVGARSASQCKDRCPAGKYYDDDAGLCRSCGHGFYQPNEGSFKCLLCGLGKTTRTTEAVSQDECRDECESGMQLAMEGQCEPCPRGTYRTQGVEPACQTCPIGRTTPKSGATNIEECTLPICAPGTFLNGSLNSCVPCKKGTYQPNSQQTTCIPCPPNTSTRGFSSTNKSDCWNPCEMSSPDIHCDKNAHCLLIPETSDFKCECKPGFNGTGKHCTDLCDGFCENKGTCVKDARGNPSCRCVGSFIGTHCEDKSDFAYIAGSIAAIVVFLIVIALFVWMICARAKPQKEPKKLIAQTSDQTGSQVNFYYGAAPYAESIAPSHHSTYAHYYDDEEDGWEMPNYYNETYMKETLHPYGNKDDLYDRLKRHAYGKKDKSDSESEAGH